MEYSIKQFYYKICEIIYLKKQTNLRLDQIEGKIDSYLREPSHQRRDYAVEREDNARLEGNLKEWMDKHQVMEYLNIGKSTYYRWRKIGMLVPRRAFGEDRYLKEDIIILLVKR